MNVHPTAYLVCYDISGSPERLKRVYKLMRGWGDHMQLSVFRCILSPMQLAKLKGELIDVIHADLDQVLFVPLGIPDGAAEKRMFTLGQPLLHPERVCKVF